MASDVTLVARNDPEPSWSKRPGDRFLALARPSVPAAWYALFDEKTIAMAGSKPKFVALVTPRESALARLSARRAALLRVFGEAFAPALDAFVALLAAATETHLQVQLDGAYADWTKAYMKTLAKERVRTTESDDRDAWCSFFGDFQGRDAFDKPDYLVCALRG